MGPPLRLRLLAIVWYWFARPFTDVSFAYDEAEGRLHKALVAFFSPLLFLWHLFLQSPEGARRTADASAVDSTVGSRLKSFSLRSVAVHLPL